MKAARRATAALHFPWSRTRQASPPHIPASRQGMRADFPKAVLSLSYSGSPVSNRLCAWLTSVCDNRHASLSPPRESYLSRNAFFRRWSPIVGQQVGWANHTSRRRARCRVTLGISIFLRGGLKSGRGRTEISDAMPRKLIWIESENFVGFACSKCNWVFNPPGALHGDSLDEMREWYEAQRDKEFAAHVCAEHPRVTNPRTE